MLALQQLPTPGPNASYDTKPRALVLRQQNVSCVTAASASLWKSDWSTDLDRFPGSCGPIIPGSAPRFPPVRSVTADFALACTKLHKSASLVRLTGSWQAAHYQVPG